MGTDPGLSASPGLSHIPSCSPLCLRQADGGVRTERALGKETGGPGDRGMGEKRREGNLAAGGAARGKHQLGVWKSGCCSQIYQQIAVEPLDFSQGVS